MKPVLAIVAIAAVEEDVVLTAVAVEITVQENLPFFKKSIKGNKGLSGHPNAWIVFGVSS